MSAKLYLPGGVRGENFVETKVLLLVIKLRDLRGQVNRAPVVDARFVRESRERLDLDGASRQGFDVEAQEMLNLFERESQRVRVERVVAAARLKRIVTPTTRHADMENIVGIVVRKQLRHKGRNVMIRDPERRRVHDEANSR